MTAKRRRPRIALSCSPPSLPSTPPLLPSSPVILSSMRKIIPSPLRICRSDRLDDDDFPDDRARWFCRVLWCPKFGVKTAGVFDVFTLHLKSVCIIHSQYISS